MPWSLIGLKSLKATLSRMIHSARFPHALLLTGPRRGGKFTVAKDLAKALNCLEPEPDASPCGVCLSCRKIEEGNHPDFIVKRPTGLSQSLAIDDIRDLIRSLGYRPFEGQRRVVIIRKADSFREEGAGSLLKTLEEPSLSTVLILTALSESRVLPTLVSRCVRLRVPPLARAEILAALKERKNLTGPRAELLAGLSGGALGAALEWPPEEAWGRWASLDQLFGQVIEGQALGRKAVLDFTATECQELEKLKKLDQEEAKKAEEGQETSGHRQGRYTRLLEFMRLWWRDVLVLAVTRDKNRLAGPAASLAQRKWATEVSPKNLTARLKELDYLEDNLRRLSQSELVLTAYWLSLVNSLGPK